MRRALVVATSTYDDGGLARLVSPAQDASALSVVLADRETCGFDVATVVDGTLGEIARAIEDFTVGGERGDLLLLYLSCHGVKDEQGRLYFAAKDTRRDRLRSTALAAAFVNDLLFATHARQKVLLLDCCYSGAFARGLAVKGDPGVHTGEHFDARGLVVLTASDATQYAFEGDAVSGRAAPSAFTAAVVDGLSSGSADIDGDGLISVDDLFEHTRRRLVDGPGAQRPRKWEFDVGGSIVLARRPSALVALRPLPVLLAPSPAGPTRRAMHPFARWAGEFAFTVTMFGLGYAVISWLSTWPVVIVAGDAVVPEAIVAPAATAGVLAWSLVLAVGDRTDSGRRMWWWPYQRWALVLGDLVRPRGVRAFLTAAVAAVPFNVVLISVVSAVVAAIAYTADGATTRDSSFEIAFVLLAVPPLVLRLFPPKEPDRV